MTGSKPFYIIVLIILNKSDPWLKFFFFLGSNPIILLASPKDYIALLKLPSWNFPLSSTTKNSPYPPAGHK